MADDYAGRSTTAPPGRNVLYVRLNYIYRPGDDLFVVFNQSQQEVPGARNQPDRSLMVKMTYSLDF